MKNWIRLTNLFAFGFFSLALVTTYQNCARFVPNTISMALKEPSPSPSPTQEPPVDPFANKATVEIPRALLSAEQTYVSMLKITNLTPTTALNAEYTARYGALAAGNEISQANAPLMLATTSLAGEICNGVIAKEEKITPAERTFFEKIDFTKPLSANSEDAYKSSLRKMARAFWGREETPTELNLLNDFKTTYAKDLAEAMRTNAQSTRNLMLVTCSAMLSSFEAITY